MYRVAGSQKSVTAKLLQSPQAVKMDNLTVTRLRNECRLRRLPVSGRKRNLVLRLLPFADVILNVSRTTEIDAAACVSYDAGVTHSITGPIATPEPCKSQPVEPEAEVEFHRPFVSLDSFISGWSNCDSDDWTMEEGTAADPPQSTGIVRRRITGEVESAYPPTVRDNPVSSITNHVDFLIDPDADKSGTDVDGYPPLSDDVERADTPSAGESETLVCRWLRQQRLIDELRLELCRYRRALATARLQSLARSSSNVGSDLPSSFREFSNVDHGTGDQISPCSASMSYGSTKRYSIHTTLYPPGKE